MKKTLLVFIATFGAGFAGACLDSMLQLNGSLGVILSVATVGAFIVSAIENKRSK